MAVSQPRTLPYPSSLPSPWSSVTYSRALSSKDLAGDNSEDSSLALNLTTDVSPSSPNCSYSQPSSPPLASSSPQPPLPPSSPTSSTLRTVQSTLAAVQGLQAYLNRYSMLLVLLLISMLPLTNLLGLGYLEVRIICFPQS